MVVIRWKPGNYYVGMVAIGPMFGGTLREAKRFKSERDAHLEKSLHWGFACAKVIKIKED